MRIYWNWKSKRFKRHIVFDFQSMKNPNTKTMGMSFRIPHTTLYIVGFDYDNITDDRLDEELQWIQEVDRLGDIHVLSTSEFARHAICVDTMSLREAIKIVYDDSTCDYLFKKGILINEYRTWVLRGWEKGERVSPEYMRTIESPYNGERVQSEAHAEYLKAKFGIPVRLVNPDGNDLLEIQTYLTSSLVTVKELLKERGTAK